MAPGAIPARPAMEPLSGKPSTGEVLLERAESLGHTTNNVAEYSGLIAGLRAAADLGAVEVDVRMDSQLVVEQMSGRWQIKNAGLRPLAAEAAALANRFAKVRYTWIPRAENRHADALANAAMDGKRIEDLPSPPAAGLPEAAPSSSPGGLLAGGPRSWVPPSAASATRLVLVRHGETDLTAQGRYSGRADVPLSHKGRLQVMATAARLTTVVAKAGRRGDALHCRGAWRPPRRSRGTSTSRYGCRRDLIECDFGEWEGLTFAQVREGWPDELAAWLESPAVAPPGGESFQDVATRVRAAVDDLLAQYAGETVVVVSHVTPIKLILRDALAAGECFLHRLFLDAAGISIVDSWPDGGVAVRVVNETAHLSAL